MSMMNSRNLLRLLLVVSVAFNLLFVVGFVTARAPSAPEHSRSVSEPTFEETIGLSADQLKARDLYRARVYQGQRPLRNAQTQQLTELVKLIASADADMERADELLDELAAGHRKFSGVWARELHNYLIQLTPEQRKAYCSWIYGGGYRSDRR